MLQLCSAISFVVAEQVAGLLDNAGIAGGGGFDELSMVQHAAVVAVNCSGCGPVAGAPRLRVALSCHHPIQRSHELLNCCASRHAGSSTAHMCVRNCTIGSTAFYCRARGASTVGIAGLCTTFPWYSRTDRSAKAVCTDSVPAAAAGRTAAAEEHAGRAADVDVGRSASFNKPTSQTAQPLKMRCGPQELICLHIWRGWAGGLRGEQGVRTAAWAL